MTLEQRLNEIKYLNRNHLEYLKPRIEEVIENFDSNIVELYAYGSCVTGATNPEDLDLLVIVKQLPAKDPISRQDVYTPLSPQDSNRPNPEKAPRITFSKNEPKTIEEHYLYTEYMNGLKIDWNVATLRQYEKWKNKIPNDKRVILFQ